MIGQSPSSNTLLPGGLVVLWELLLGPVQSLEQLSWTEGTYQNLLTCSSLARCAFVCASRTCMRTSWTPELLSHIISPKCNSRINLNLTSFFFYNLLFCSSILSHTTSFTRKPLQSQTSGSKQEFVPWPYWPYLVCRRVVVCGGI